MKKLYNSFRYACTGLYKAYSIEGNLKLALVITIAVIRAAVMLEISHNDRLIILLGIGGIHAFEMLNTAIEKLCDHVNPEYHETIGTVKDIAAGASLMFIITSLVVGIVVFSRYL